MGIQTGCLFDAFSERNYLLGPSLALAWMSMYLLDAATKQLSQTSKGA
jgi:hypothetical protein